MILLFVSEFVSNPSRLNLFGVGLGFLFGVKGYRNGWKWGDSL